MKVIVTQTETIVRRYILEVPDGYNADMIQEAFFEQDIASDPHVSERYNVDLDIDMSPGEVPVNDPVSTVE